MIAGKTELSSRGSLSSTSSSSSSNTLVLRQREGEASRGYDMQFSDIIDVDIRQEVGMIRSSYPSYPLLYLIYVLVRSNRSLDQARDFLENTHRNRAQYLPITSITNIDDVKDDVMRNKVESIRTVAPWVTVWWALYALQVCDGSIDCATSLLLEGAVDASNDPRPQIAPVSGAHVYSPATPTARRNVLGKLPVDLPSDSDSSVFGCTTPSQTSGEESFHTSLSSIEPSHQTPNSPLVNTSEDDKDSTAEETDTLVASPYFNNRRVVGIDKGKGVAKTEPDHSSDINMNGVLSFKKGSQAKKNEKQNGDCKFCGKDLGSWLARNNHESSCRRRTRQVCVKCKKEVSKANIRRHESRCDGPRNPRRDGSEFAERDVFMFNSRRKSVSRGSSPSIDSDFPTEEELQKALQLCDGDVEDAVHLEMEASTSGEEDDDRGSYSQQENPLKRKLGSPSRSRTQIGDTEAGLQPASQWIKTTFLDLCQNSTNLTLVHLSGTETHAIPTKLMCDNSKYLKDLISPTGDQDAALKEINLLDVEPTLFDAIIQYMVCHNVSFGPQLSEIQAITSIVNFIVLAEKFKVAGPATTMYPTLEAILKQDRKGPHPPSVLKVGHVHKIFSNLDDPHHPIRKLFVRASVRPHIKEKNDNNVILDDSDDEYEVDADDVDFRNQPAHLAWKLNRDFGMALLAKVDQTNRNRERRPIFPNSKNSKSFSEWFTDPLDGSQFTL
ncbi:hypothetical protein SBOR_4276 [Sclerotinia borealis F-4128]|uniref:BTB domain-containing protein n=1 Tax=Sclerotinia borealis (strain F-4128) TaxID=1432307 RepID=W9CF36_SCLBF|nr:hypothetical protein SBOR_4276 [Sclerotinia borealis F-4128]